MPLTTFTAGTVIRSADVNANFALCLLKENVNTNGGILFGNGTTVTQDATNFLWDDANNRVGVQNNSPTAPITIGKPTNGTNTAIITGTLFHLMALDSTANYTLKDAFGSSNQIIGRRAQGTSASKTTLVATAIMLRLGGQGADSNNNYNSNTAVSIDLLAEGTWSTTSLPTGISFKTTPSGSTTLTEVMKLDSSGQLGIGVTPTSRNNTRLQIIDGIGFPATQVSSSDANTLDDYEEGSYTPTVTANSGSFTTVSATGHYTKIGRVVKVFATITITTNGTAATTVNFSVPFTSTADHEIYGCGRESATTGVSLSVALGKLTTTAVCRKYDGTYPGGTGNIIEATIIYYV